MSPILGSEEASATGRATSDHAGAGATVGGDPVPRSVIGIELDAFAPPAPKRPKASLHQLWPVLMQLAGGRVVPALFRGFHRDPSPVTNGDGDQSHLIGARFSRNILAVVATKIPSVKAITC